MSKLRNLVAGLFSVGLVFSSYSGLSVAQAITAPTLVEAEAENSGGTSAIEAGDSIELEFSENTNEFALTADNIDDILSLNNSHSWLDGEGDLGDVEWTSEGDELTITLSDGTSLPTVAVGDTITIEGDDLEDEDGNPFTGSVVIGGSFTANDDDGDDEDTDEDCDDVTATVSNSGSDDDDEDEDANEQEDEDSNDDSDCDEDSDNSGSGKLECNNALNNGKLYKIGSEATVYLAHKHCILKPFRGAAVFHARGHKFQDVISLGSLPTGVTISGEPALPVEGTLIKGSDKTVWFVDHNGKRRGFTSAEVFTKLGFRFGQVQTISDSDLGELPSDGSNVSDDTHHPDGSLMKCGNSPAVFLVVGGERFPFASAEAFEGRGHSFEHVLNVDCGRFAYHESTPITE